MSESTTTDTTPWHPGIGMFRAAYGSDKTVQDWIKFGQGIYPGLPDHILIQRTALPTLPHELSHESKLSRPTWVYGIGFPQTEDTVLNPAVRFAKKYTGLCLTYTFTGGNEELSYARADGVNRQVVRYVLEDRMKCKGVPGAVLAHDGDKECIVAALFCNYDDWTEDSLQTCEAIKCIKRILEMGDEWQAKWYPVPFVADEMQYPPLF